MKETVLGSSFDEFVSKQLDTRVKILSSTNEQNIGGGKLPKTNLEYTLANTAFLRLSSAVNIESEEKALFFGKKEYQGNGLAKNFILQGGTLTKDGALRGGLASYQVGSTKDFGLRPMPGIVQATVVSRGRWGSLREASIDIKCFNRDQLSIVETLYLRPGYTILLEWGNSTFYDNNFNLINNVRFIDFFQDGKTLNDIHEQILNKREKYSGNYDGFVGPVSNFNIKQLPDGSYNCTIKATSWGGIIESLKLNTTSNPSTDNSTDKSTILPDQSTNSSSPKLLPESLDDSRFESIINVINKTCGKYNNGNIWKIFISDAYKKYYDNHPTGHSITSNLTPIDSGSLATFAVIPFSISSNNKIDGIGGRSAGSGVSRPALNYYISLGALLSIISKNCLLYSSNNVPIININFNPSENFCYSPEHHISIDPNICLIRYDGPDFSPLSLSKATTAKINYPLPQFKESKTVGRTMNIMLNTDFIIRKLKQISANSETPSVYDFLTELMNGINVALGDVNEFNVGVDGDTNTLMIYDTQILDNSKKTLTVINTTGLKSSVRDIYIDSKLSGQLASMIAIGAQAGGEATQGIDASMFLQYNKDLKDRFIPIKKDIEDNLNKSYEEYIRLLETDERAQFLKRHIENIYSKRMVISDDIDSCKLFYKEIIKTLKVKDHNFNGIIPFTFNIKMNGLSGVQYGQLFSIEPSRLPKSYLDPQNKNQPLVAFLVSTIEHHIESNSWTTNIGGQTAPIRDLKIKQ